MPKKRKQIANNGKDFIQKSNWEKAVKQMESILIDIFDKAKMGKSFHNLQKDEFTP